MSDDYIYDRYGAVQLSIDDEGAIFAYRTGKVIGYTSKGVVYDYYGRHVGWYENGVLRDVNGNVVGFNDEPSDFPQPIFPITQIRPFEPVRSVAPAHPNGQISPMIKPYKQFFWSAASPLGLFSIGGY